MKTENANNSYKGFSFFGIALDPIHVGTGGSRLGRVDNTIVRDPVTRIPKIPGSSLAGVMRAYTAMAKEKYPNCAGLGHPEQNGTGSHCGKHDCEVCTVFGVATGKDSGGGFAGLAGFNDMHVLLFPVASQLGPQWITAPMALRQIDGNEFTEISDLPDQNAYYCSGKGQIVQRLNLGWLFLPVKPDEDKLKDLVAKLKEFGLPQYVCDRIGVVSDKLFAHIVNSNLEVRTSVAINPATGAAEVGALFTYEALPRGTVLVWELICRNPKHFKINGNDLTAVDSTDAVKEVIACAHSYLEHLGIGGMGTRGMGRLRVLAPTDSSDNHDTAKEG